MKFTKAEYSFILGWAKRHIAINARGKVCQQCGESSFWCLDFHHPDKTQKEHKISAIRWASLPSFMKEVDKCTLLCSNCHQAEHSNPLGRDFRRKKLLLEVIGRTKCTCCNKEVNPAALSFHHVDGDVDFRIGNVIARKVNVDLWTFLEELRKCVVICRNCHRKKHADTDQYERLKHAIEQCMISHRPMSPPTDKEEVKRMCEQGFTQIEIARKLGRAKSTICNIVAQLKTSPG